jgi:DNA polymerase V
MGLKTSGFASPAQGYEEGNIDLNRLLVHNPPATYFFRLGSEAMSEMGLAKGTLLVVDRSKTACINDIVLVRHEGQFLCRLLTRHNGKTLFSNGKEYIHPIENETELIGTITAAIKIFGGNQ